MQLHGGPGYLHRRITLDLDIFSIGPADHQIASLHLWYSADSLSTQQADHTSFLATGIGDDLLCLSHM